MAKPKMSWITSTPIPLPPPTGWLTYMGNSLSTISFPVKPFAFRTTPTQHGLSIDPEEKEGEGWGKQSQDDDDTDNDNDNNKRMIMTRQIRHNNTQNKMRRYNQYI